MDDWIDRETATAKFGTRKASTAKARKSKPRKSKARNAGRLQKRLQKVLESMSHKASLKFPAGCKGPAEVKAAYRFLDNEHVTFLSILTPHRDATIERIREQTGGPDPARHDRTRHHAARARSWPEPARSMIPRVSAFTIT